MAQPVPIITAHLFPELDRHLVEVLRDLQDDDWQRPTLAPKWNVRQVVAHLLDTALRRLSFGRDGWRLPAPDLTDDRSLVAFVDDLNARGVALLGALSPRVLIDLTTATLPSLHAYLESLDPMAPATLGVSWAGEMTSLVWFDVARELTERWHHQQQIRDATSRPPLMTPRLYRPVLDCFMRGAPHAYRNLAADEGTLVRVVITGDAGGRWLLERRPDGWILTVPDADDRRSVASEVVIPAEIAWRIFTKGMAPAEAEQRVAVSGDPRLGSHMFRMVAIVG